MPAPLALLTVTQGAPMSQHQYILLDSPAAGLSRITLNRPDSRNALNNGLRGEILAQLEANDADDAVRVTILRGAGSCFCAGYDLKSNTCAFLRRTFW